MSKDEERVHSPKYFDICKEFVEKLKESDLEPTEMLGVLEMAKACVYNTLNFPASKKESPNATDVKPKKEKAEPVVEAE